MCLQPITIYVNSKYDAQGTRNVQVPCGKCAECRRKYQNSWYVRFYEECNNYSNFIFFTLTYRDNTVPFSVDHETGECYNSVYKRDIQLWMKQFRKALSEKYGRSLKLKYFITSEYGPRTLRPHYHGIMWGVNYNDFKLLGEIKWQERFGFTTSKLLSSPSLNKHADSALRYVSKYCSKGDFENPLVEELKVHKTFHLMSKGIGKSYIIRKKDWHLCEHIKDKKKRIEAICSRRFYKIKNYSYALPRYFKDLIYGTKNYLSYIIGRYVLSEYDRLYNQKLVALSASRNISVFEASNVLFFQGLNENKYKERQLIKDTSRFLQTSRI